MGFALSEMRVTSAAFEHRGMIPTRHTAYGDNVSPPLEWADVPSDAESFAMICHDPDAPVVTPQGGYGYAHWVLYNIPGDVRQVAEGVDAALYTTGVNEPGESVYFGPRPPEGHGVHAYYFWLLALRRAPTLPGGLDLRSLLALIEPDVVGMNRLVGVYEQPAA